MKLAFVKHALQDPSFKLLQSSNVVLIIGFLAEQFKKKNRPYIPNDELVSSLSDFLFNVREAGEEGLTADSPQNYLDSWATKGFLRKRYREDSDEPVFELTSSTERVLEWFQEMQHREFIGTESRLRRIFEMLYEIVALASEDTEERLTYLQRKRAELDEQIEKLKKGLTERLSSTQAKESYYNISDTARKLLSDFKQIEENFRTIDRQVRLKQKDETMPKGKFLDEVFGLQQNMIWETDQGRSFKAFWEHLMTPGRQEELSSLIVAVARIPDIRALTENDMTLRRLHINLVEAADNVNRVNHRLIEQLRRFLDDKLTVERKRIADLISDIKGLALECADSPMQDKEFFHLDGHALIDMTLDRSLWLQQGKSALDSTQFETGDQDTLKGDSLDALYQTPEIDAEDLRLRIDELLEDRQEIGLGEVIAEHPIEHGVLEILSYLQVAQEDPKNNVEDSEAEKLRSFNKETQSLLNVTSPKVTYKK
ncbi:MAG: DUF3375 domain-containing protein [Thermodesulfovibrionales bacterium]|jgi:hypothetical protein